MPSPRSDGRLLRGEQTRQTILRHAVDLASAEGLAGLSIGRLATDLGLSKSGVFMHFGAKEELQVATVQAAAEIFVSRVIEPARAVPRGLGRVWALCQARHAYLAEPVFAGGCFFYSVAAEFDTRPGRVREAIARNQRAWADYLERSLAQARELGEISESADPAQLAFEFEALSRAGGGDALLYDEPAAIDRARQAVLTRLRAVATDPSALPAD